MALVLKDRVREITNTSGTGPVTLIGAVSGFQSFAAIGDGNVTYYVISSPSTGNWEVGYGTYSSAGPSLSRDFVYASSNANALVNFGSEQKDVLCTYPAEQAIYQETNGSLRLVGGTIGLTQDGTEGTTLPNTSFQAFTTGNYYMQANQQNLSSGAEASSDWVSTADNGTDTDNYMDMGMASSGYNFPDYSSVKANSGYVLSTGSDLRLIAGKFGAVTPGAQDIVFVAGSTKDTEERLRIKGNTGNVILDSTNPTDTGEKLQVVGTAKITGATTFGSTVTLHQDPSGLLEAATKQYVDNSVAAGLTVHAPVRVEAVVPLTVTYDNGVSGVGATLTNAGAQAALVVDGVTVNVNDRVLIYLQADATQNGVYVVTDTGSGSTNWVLTRATDADSYNPNDPDALEQGAYFYVQEGNTAAGESYTCTNVGTIVFGTTPITFSQFSASPTFTGVAPIDVSGQTISLTGTVSPTNGGTGLSSFVVGDLLYSNLTNTLTKLPIGTTGQPLIVAGGVPSWGSLDLAGSGTVSGALPEVHGGTNQTSYATGDILYASATNTLAKLPGNTTTTKYFLSQTGTGSAAQAPSWAQLTASDVSGLAASATTDTTNAANITSGTLPSNRLIGGYTGVTAVGTLSSLAVSGDTVISTNSSTDALRITQTGSGNALVVEDSANPDSTPFVVNNGGGVTVGYTANPFIPGVATNFAVVGTNNLTSSAGIARYSGDTDKPRFVFFKSRGAIGSHGVVSSSDQTGQLIFAGSDGTAFIQSAAITAEVDGTPGTNDMPGRLVFSTTADGASTPTERMRINNAGRVGVNTTSPLAYVNVGGNYSSTNSTTAIGVTANGIATDVTSTGLTGYSTFLSPGAGVSLNTIYHYEAGQRAFAGTVVNQRGFSVSGSLTGATNNYGFYSDIASGTGRWNFFANGTAANYFAGDTFVGTTTNTNSSKLVVNGTISETVNSTQYLIASEYDIGSAPNQIPLNQYLGSAAYVNLPSGGLVGVTETQTLTNKTLTGTKETRVAIPASDIDLSAGNYFTKTISGATTFTVSNVAASGSVSAFVLELTNGGSAAVTFFSGVDWPAATPPTLTASGVDVLAFFTTDGGVNWRGFVLGLGMA